MTEEVLQLLLNEQLINDFLSAEFIYGDKVFIAEKNVRRTKKIIKKINEQLIFIKNSSSSMGISGTDFRGNVEYYNYPNAIFILVKKEIFEDIKQLLLPNNKVFFHEKIQREKLYEVDWDNSENWGHC